MHYCYCSWILSKMMSGECTASTMPEVLLPFPTLCRVHCQVTDNYFIWYLSTCSQTGILYLQNCLLSTILCWLCPPFSLSGGDGWSGKGTTYCFVSSCFSQFFVLSWSSGPPSEQLQGPAPGKAHGWKTNTWEPSDFLSSSGRSPLWNPPSSSQGTASRWQDTLHSPF